MDLGVFRGNKREIRENTVGDNAVRGNISIGDESYAMRAQDENGSRASVGGGGGGGSELGSPALNLGAFGVRGGGGSVVSGGGGGSELGSPALNLGVFGVGGGGGSVASGGGSGSELGSPALNLAVFGRSVTEITGIHVAWTDVHMY